MTREDIDNIISIICPNDEDFEKTCISPAYLKKELEALALEQKPCEDAISRQAVLNMQYRIDDSVTLSTRDVVNVDDIEDLPPVTPQPKIGHWIRGHYGFGCSNCHKSIEGKWDDNIDDITGTLFCPNCGAKMQEVEENG